MERERNHDLLWLEAGAPAGAYTNQVPGRAFGIKAWRSDGLGDDAWTAFREEFFGPVALFFRVKNEDEAVALANDSEFGLGGAVFTKDVARGKRVASRVDTGMMFVNHPTWTTPDLPFGGIKNSGYGRELSSLGIQEFVNKKLVRVSAIDAPA